LVWWHQPTHVSHQQTNRFDLDLSALHLLGDALLDQRRRLDLLEHAKLLLCPDLHVDKLLSLAKDARNPIALSVVVNELVKHLTVSGAHVADVALLLEKLAVEEAVQHHHHDEEEADQDVHLVLLFLQASWKSNADLEVAWAVWVAVLRKVHASSVVGQDCVGLGDQDEVVLGLGVVNVLVRMQFA